MGDKMKQWAEVKMVEQEDVFVGRLIGTHDTGDNKPDPVYGGDECLPLSEIEYEIIQSCRGNLELALETIENLRKRFLSDESYS